MLLSTNKCSGEWLSYSGSSSQMYQEKASIVLYCTQESDYFDQRFLDKNYSKIAASYNSSQDNNAFLWHNFTQTYDSGESNDYTTDNNHIVLVMTVAIIVMMMQFVFAMVDQYGMMVLVNLYLMDVKMVIHFFIFQMKIIIYSVQ